MIWDLDTTGQRHTSITFFANYSSNTTYNVCYLGAFRLYDVDNDGYITREEMYNIVDAIYQMVVSIKIHHHPL